MFTAGIAKSERGAVKATRSVAQYNSVWSKVSPAAANIVYVSNFVHLFLHIAACHLGTFDIMKGINIFVVFLVLSASLLYTSEAARSRTSNQNSFRRAANGIYQTLSSLFGEDNIKSLYKVR